MGGNAPGMLNGELCWLCIWAMGGALKPACGCCGDTGHVNLTSAYE